MATLYFVVTDDGQQHGPVEMDQLQQWAREGRVAPKTVIQRDSDNARLLASELPELAPIVNAPPITVPAVQPPDPLAYPGSGSRLQVGQDGRPLKSKVAAGLLGILAGSVGAHRFYLGYTSTGAWMVVACVVTCGYGSAITAIIGLVEGIMCLTGKMKDAEGRPLGD